MLIDDRKRAYGVEYRRHGKVRTVYATKEVIVSAGAINSPQLLLLSGIGPRKHLNSMGVSRCVKYSRLILYYQTYYILSSTYNKWAPSADQCDCGPSCWPEPTGSRGHHSWNVPSGSTLALLLRSRGKGWDTIRIFDKRKWTFDKFWHVCGGFHSLKLRSSTSQLL